MAGVECEDVYIGDRRKEAAVQGLFLLQLFCKNFSEHFA